MHCCKHSLLGTPRQNYLAGVAAITAAFERSDGMPRDAIASCAMITATPTRSYGDCQMALQGNLNHDKTPRGAGRGVHLSSGRSEYVRRPRISRVADASTRKKGQPRAAMNDETEYYKVS